jgi:flagellar operon protein
MMDHRIHQVPAHALQFPTHTPPKSKKPEVAFQDVLKKEQSLKLSKHAASRLSERNIDISASLWKTIGEKVQEAKKKNVTDSLVVLNDATLLVSAKNNTVITALNREEAANRIFTNINGTIVIDE